MSPDAGVVNGSRCRLPTVESLLDRLRWVAKSDHLTPSVGVDLP